MHIIDKVSRAILLTSFSAHSLTLPLPPPWASKLALLWQQCASQPNGKHQRRMAWYRMRRSYTWQTRHKGTRCFTLTRQSALLLYHSCLNLPSSVSIVVPLHACLYVHIQPRYHRETFFEYFEARSIHQYSGIPYQKVTKQLPELIILRLGTCVVTDWRQREKMHDDWHQQHYQISSAVQRHHVTQFEPLLPTLKDLKLDKNDLINLNNNHGLNQPCKQWNQLMGIKFGCLQRYKKRKHGILYKYIDLIAYSLDIVQLNGNKIPLKSMHFDHHQMKDWESLDVFNCCAWVLCCVEIERTCIGILLL